MVSTLLLEYKGVLDKVSIPDRDFSWFRLRPPQPWSLRFQFQSLIGILVGFDANARLPLPCSRSVSIPDRDFSWFRPAGPLQPSDTVPVSIPDRDFSWFRQTQYHVTCEQLSRFNP